MKKQFCYFILPISLLTSSSFLLAEISTDGSVGPQVNLNGPNFHITEELGSRVGDNLFHSFSNFNILNGESATFTGANNISNVISRVTGGSISTIDGLLESQIGQADFYFINPNGILFGQNAQINVPAAFHVSTADSLIFSDGSQFNAVNPDSSSLTVATPSSFGFTDQQPAKIVMDGSLISMDEGQHISLTSGELEADSAQVLSEAGTVSIVAVGQTNTNIALDTPILDQSELNASGRLTLNNSQINVSGNGGGQINIAAGETKFIITDLFNTNSDESNQVQESNISVQSLDMDNAWIKNDSTNSGQAPSINLLVKNDLSMLNGSILTSSAFGSGDAGNVYVSASNLSIDRQGSEFLTGIVSNVNAESTGNAGTVTLQILDSLEILNRGEIGSNTFAAGNAGQVYIEAGSIYIDGKNVDGLTGISSQATSTSTGEAGSIEIVATDSIELFDSGVISSSTFSSGNAGNIAIDTNSIYINRFNADSTTGVFSNASGVSTGNAGNILINAGDFVAVVDGGKIASSSFSEGDAGNIEINAKQLFLHDSGSVYSTGILSNVESGSLGNAGQLDINIDGTTEIYAGAILGSNTFSSGNAGTVNFTGIDILIDDLGANSLTGIASQTNSTGHAGELNIKISGNFTLQNGGEISTNTFGSGNAGTINIHTNKLNINNQSSEILTGIVSNSGGSGHAGAVNLVVENHANIVNGGQIASSSFASGNAGQVSIVANTFSIDGQDSERVTGIFSNAQEDSQGNAGQISVETIALLEILDGGEISSVTKSSGDAGSVSIKAENLNLDGKESSFFTGISSDAELNSTGIAGEIFVDISNLTSIINGAEISSNTSSVGNAGSIFVNTGQLYLQDRGSGIFSNAELSSSGHAGEIWIDVSGLTSIFDAAEIGSNTFANGNAGKITFNSQQLLIDAGEELAITGIFSDAISGSGNGGSLDINISEQAILQNGGKIASNTYSTGNAGDINLNTKNLTIDGQTYPFATGVNSIAKENSQGHAGAIHIQVTENLNIINGGEISTNTLANGNAGFIAIEAQNIEINRAGNDRFTGIFSDAESGSSGNAGSLKVKVTDTLNVINGAWLSSNTESLGDAGDIEIVSNSIKLDAQNSGILTGFLSNAEVGAQGDAGQIKVETTEQLSVLGGAQISSNTYAQGNAGQIQVVAKNLLLDASNAQFTTGIFSSAESGSQGHAGQLFFDITDSIEINSGATITTITEGLGNAGDIQIFASNLSIDRQGSFSTGISSNSESTDQGKAGAIEIKLKNDLSIFDGASINSNTFSKGDAGQISISAKNLLIDAKDSQLFTAISSQAGTDSTGNAGILDIDLSGELKLLNGGKITTDTFAVGNAGDIVINTVILTLDDQLNSELATGIFTNTRSTENGNAGSITINASEQINILNGAEISSNTFSKGNAGIIDIDANKILLDRQTADSFTGIFSDAKSGSSGNAGAIQLQVNDQLTIQNGAWISSNTESVGNAGNIKIETQSINLDANNSGILTGIISNAKINSTGDAGTVEVVASGLVEILEGAQISSNTSGQGNAGQIQIKAKELVLDNDNSSFFTGVFSSADENSQGNAGQLFIDIHDAVSIFDGAKINTSTEGTGNAGDITLFTNSLSIDRQDGFPTGIFSNTLSTENGNAGSISINARDHINIYRGGEISSNTFSKGYAGLIQIETGSLNIARLDSNLFTGIFSDAKTNSQGNAGSIIVKASDSINLDNGRITSNTEINSSGHAGEISIQADNDIVIKNSSEIGSNTSAIGNAGSIEVSAKNLYLDGTGAEFRTGLFSNAEEVSSGNAGSIVVNISEQLEIKNGSEISSNTNALGDAGDINVKTNQLILNGEGSTFRTGISSNAEATSSGTAGFIQIEVNDAMEVLSGARVSSDTYSIGDAGNIIIDAKSLIIDTENASFSAGIFSSARPDSSGNAGSIFMDIKDSFSISNARISSDANENAQGHAGSIKLSVGESLSILNGAEVGSNTEGVGDAGDVTINANNILINEGSSNSFTGIGSDTFGSATGDAGQLIIHVNEQLKLFNGGEISSSTFTSGNAGAIIIEAGQIVMDIQNGQYTGISSSSNSDTNEMSGQVGNISINTGSIDMNNAAIINISSSGLVESADQSNVEQSIVIKTKELTLNNGSVISAESSGNSPAANIEITSSETMKLNSDSAITTESVISDAGKITINSGLLSIDNSKITTSVSGSQGNGGDISVTSPALIMKTGFIQANTAAAGASGGDILIDTPQLIFPSNQVFLTNQDERIEFVLNSPQNVIQAAAPDGVSGNVSVTAPTLDISSSILNISTRFSDQTKISKNPCKVSAGAIPSSLTWAGQGGLPSSHADSIHLPLGKRIMIKEQQKKLNNNQGGINKSNTPTNKNQSKLDCLASK